LPTSTAAARPRSTLLAVVSGLAIAASMAMLAAIVAVHGTGFALVMPLFTAMAVVFALRLHGMQGDLAASVTAGLLTLLASAVAAALTVGVRMAINFRMELHQVLLAMGPEMTWAIWRARQTLLADVLLLAGVALAAWLAYRPLRTARRR
jgi:hypothetical protein